MRSKTIVRNLILALVVSVFCISALACHASAEKGTAVRIKVGSKSFSGVFYDNDTAKALMRSMPVKLKMSELNGNEKYIYLDKDLPTDEKKVKKIKAGDIMLYGSDCLVVFYKSFSTTYEYTRVGRITDPKGLTKAAGKGDVTVSFSKKSAVSLSAKKLTLEPGQAKTIRLKGASAKKVKWSSSNKKAVSVSNGRIRAKRAGSATVTAKYRNKKYKCRVTVRAQAGSGAEKNDAPAAVSDTAGKTEAAETKQPQSERSLTMKIGNTKVAVAWEDNESVAALRALASEKPLTIQMSMYGGFEQVGPIGSSLPSSDSQTTTSAGDIVLYSGNQIVVFYGSNSWSYTRLGHITDQDASGMRELLGNGAVTITISAEDLHLI